MQHKYLQCLEINTRSLTTLTVLPVLPWPDNYEIYVTVVLDIIKK